jgi:hypothetical protein
MRLLRDHASGLGRRFELETHFMPYAQYTTLFGTFYTDKRITETEREA